MPEDILVVEYEPRYTDRVKQALAGQTIVPSFAKDGEEALRVLESQQPRLIVLSSVVPKVSTPELIRAIRGRKPLSETPILVTVSGYNGKSPKQDAVRMGASDILPKPYSESEFLGKVQQMLGVRPDSTGKTWAPELDPEFTARPVAAAPGDGGGFTSNEIFGELLEDDNRAAPSGAKKVTKPKDDLDKMLADTLAGVMPQKKKDTSTLSGNVPLPQIPKPAPPPPPPPAPAPAAPAPAQPAARKPTSTPDFDKMLNDTLSGLSPRPKTQSGNVPTPAPAKPAAPATPPPQPAAPKYQTARMPAIQPEKVVAASPVIPPPPAPVAVEEEEPNDGTKFGQYVLLEKIATGGMAEVWKARMRGVEGFQKIVAIKKILPHLSDNQDFIEMFIDEAKLAAQLNHNNIIHIYDLGKIQSSYYIAMEYIDGHDLKTILKRGEERDQPMTVEIALFVASKVAAALDYAHRKHDFEGKEMSLVHRDVSPQNVLISQEGDIKLCDFGIAKAASKASHTQAGALKGKLQYMSPEQAWGRSIDKRSDIFALATVLFEMITGRKLFTGDNELSILEQVREARVTPPSEFNDEVTPEIDKIVLKALQKDPANRYQTAGEMERDINAILYTFRPTPTSADLAIFMHRLLTSAPVIRDDHDFGGGDPFATATPHSTPAAPAAPAFVAAPPIAAPAPSPATGPAIATPTFGIDSAPKKSPIIPIAIAAALVVIVGAVVMLTRKPAAPAAPLTTSAAKPATTTAPQTASTGTTALAPAMVPTSSAPSIDQSKVNEEVQKRLAAERTKLEQQQKAQQQTTPAPAPVQVARNTPPPVTPVPQPAAQAAAPVAQPVEQRPAPPVPTPQPQPQPVAPAPVQEVRAHEGDTVAAGTEGLTPPRMTHQAPVSYPPMAKMQKIEGLVIMSVMINESGQVMDVKVIKGDPRLNAAAEQSVRRSTFAPASKDGVRVKSAVPVSINFKL